MHEFAQSLSKEGVGASHFAGCTLSDLMDLWRAGKSASEVAASPDSIAMQAAHVRQASASETPATSRPPVTTPHHTAPPIWAQHVPFRSW